MKRNVVVLGASVLAAGVASAFALASFSQPSRVAPQLAAAEPEPKSPPAPVSFAASAKPTLEVRHAPVPLLLKPRPAIERPTVEASQATAAATKPVDTSTEVPKSVDTPVADTPVDAGGGTVAKAAVEADGYKAVKVLRKGDNGLWYAEGLRGSTKVQLIVDAQGTVTSQ
jgi:hypothetical protein